MKAEIKANTIVLEVEKSNQGKIWIEKKFFG